MGNMARINRFVWSLEVLSLPLIKKMAFPFKLR